MGYSSNCFETEPHVLAHGRGTVLTQQFRRFFSTRCSRSRTRCKTASSFAPSGASPSCAAALCSELSAWLWVDMDFRSCQVMQSQSPKYRYADKCEAFGTAPAQLVERHENLIMVREYSIALVDESVDGAIAKTLAL